MQPLSIRTPPPPAHIQQRPTLTLTPPDAHPSIYPCTSIPTTSVGGDRRSIDHHLTTTPFFSSRVLAHNHTTRRHTTTQRNDAAGVRGIPPPPFPPISHLLPTPPRMQQRTNGRRTGAKATGTRVLGVYLLKRRWIDRVWRKRLPPEEEEEGCTARCHGPGFARGACGV